MNVAIILLAGKGERFKSTVTKNLSTINNKYLFNFVIDTCLKNKNIGKIVLVVNKNEKSIIASKYSKNKNVHVVVGSLLSRQASLNIGVKFISKYLKPSDILITLDGDRIFVSNKLINKSIEISKKHGYSCANIKLVDSIVSVNTCDIKYLNRDKIYCIQTPQAIQYKFWNNKQKIGNDLFTSLNLKLDKSHLFDGDPLNFKITFKKDLELAKKIKLS